MDNYREEFNTALLEIDRLTANKIAQEIIDNESLDYFLEEVFIPVLDDVGKSWEHDDISLSQVYMSGKICEELVDKYFVYEGKKPLNSKKLAIASFGTYQTLGKSIVCSLLKGYGYELTDYGYGIETKKLVELVLRDEIEILLISVLMLPSAIKINELVEELAKVSPKTKILVGGAPFRFDKNLWKEVHADAMGESVREAHQILQKWMKEA